MSQKNDKLDIGEITKRLDVIIYFLLDQRRQQGKSNREIIKEMSEWGLKDFEIAKILGKSRGYVSGELTQIRKLTKSRGRKNER